MSYFQKNVIEVTNLIIFCCKPSTSSCVFFFFLQKLLVIFCNHNKQRDGLEDVTGHFTCRISCDTLKKVISNNYTVQPLTMTPK